MANIFDTKNAGLPWETFSNASGKPKAIVRTSREHRVVIART